MASNNYDTETVKGRLLTYLKHKRITQAEFCKAVGVASTYINVIRKSIPSDKVNRIVSLYPDLNRDWLLYGEGEMLTADRTDPEGTASQRRLSRAAPTGERIRGQHLGLVGDDSRQGLREGGEPDSGSGLRHPDIGRQHGAGVQGRVADTDKENRRQFLHSLGASDDNRHHQRSILQKRVPLGTGR